MVLYALLKPLVLCMLKRIVKSLPLFLLISSLCILFSHFFTSKEREALQSGEKIFILVFHMCFHPCEQRISISINKMHIQSITSHRRMWRKSSSLWDNTFGRSRKWSCKMNQILQFSVLSPSPDVRTLSDKQIEC